MQSVILVKDAILLYLEDEYTFGKSRMYRMCLLCCIEGLKVAVKRKNNVKCPIPPTAAVLETPVTRFFFVIWRKGKIIV